MRYLLLTLVLGIIGLTFPINVSAATGVTVSPSILRLDLADDPAEYELTYQNDSPYVVDIELLAQDFRDRQDGLSLEFLNPTDANDYQYSLSSWLKFSQRTISLAPNSRQSVKVSIDTAALTSGGHYAAVIAQLKPQVPIEQAPEIEIKSNLTALIFVRTHTGNEREEAKINNLQYDQDFGGLPYRFKLRFQNAGNVEVVPYGEIIITDPFQRQVGKAILNTGSLITLPETIRSYNLEPSYYAGWQWPGVYHAHAKIHYGKSNTYLYQTVRFWSTGTIPWWGYGLISFGLIVITILARKRFKALKSNQRSAD